MEFEDVLHERRSIREFKDKGIEDEKIKKLIDAVKYIPTAHNIQDYYICVVKDEERKEKLAEAALNQKFIAKAPVVFIVCTEPGKEGTKRGELYSLQASAVAAYTIELAATNLLLGSVWVGAFKEKAVSKICRLAEKHRPVAIIPVGYPAEEPKMPERRNDYFKILE